MSLNSQSSTLFFFFFNRVIMRAFSHLPSPVLLSTHLLHISFLGKTAVVDLLSNKIKVDRNDQQLLFSSLI